jgi:hypothetical protein
MRAGARLESRARGAVRCGAVRQLAVDRLAEFASACEPTPDECAAAPRVFARTHSPPPLAAAACRRLLPRRVLYRRASARPRCAAASAAHAMAAGCASA